MLRKLLYSLLFTKIFWLHLTCPQLTVPKGSVGSFLSSNKNYCSFFFEKQLILIMEHHQHPGRHVTKISCHRTMNQVVSNIFLILLKKKFYFIKLIYKKLLFFFVSCSGILPELGLFIWEKIHLLGSCVRCRTTSTEMMIGGGT